MKLSVVYIDDEMDLCEIFSEQFSSDLVTVQTFEDPLQALAFLKSNRVDLIFTDYRMPHFKGDQLVEVLGSQIPLYLITGELGVKSVAAFVKVLHKPFNLSEIRKILDDALHTHVGPATE